MRTKLIKVVLLVGLILAGQRWALAQTGPAGVGNSSSNKVWLDASFLTGLNNGARINSWTDRSGNAWNAGQATAAKRPTYLTDQLNGLPVVRFDRTNGPQYLEISITGIGPAMSNSYTLYAVVKANSGAVDNAGDRWQSVFGAIDWYSGILIEGYPTAANLWFTTWVGVNPPTQSVTVLEPLQQGQWSIATSMPKETAAGTNLSAYANGVFAGSMSNSLQTRNFTNLVRIGGCLTSGVHQYLLNGDIAEIIFYNVNLNEAQRIIVDNYLSAKYNQPIANDYYSSGETSYSKDVQGIGTTDGTVNKHITTSNGKGLLMAELNNTLNAGNEFLFAGHATSTNSLVTTDLPPGEQSRWQRIWYLQKTGNVDAKLSFDFSQASLVPEIGLNNNLSNYKLLYRSSSTGPFSIVKTGSNALVPTLENGDQLVFALTDAQLSNGYYTIGYAPSLIWTGALNEQWELPGNWNLNRVPTNAEHVFVNACTICPRLNSAVTIGGLQLNTGSALNLGSYNLSVSGTVFLNETKTASTQGVIKATDFAEIKNSIFTGSVTLEKTGGSDNHCYGGNTFSPELKIVNSSNSNWEVSSQSNNVVKTF